MADSANTTNLSRRSTLKALAALPCITAPAIFAATEAPADVPITNEMLENYATFLWIERHNLLVERYGLDGYRDRQKLLYTDNAAADFFNGQHPWKAEQPASSRAALVLNAVGIDWRQPRD